jgi:hypothetical protein
MRAWSARGRRTNTRAGGFALAAVLAAAAALAGPAPASASTPLSYSGSVAGCKYSISIDTDAKTFSGGTNSCGSTAGAITATLSGSYQDNYVKLGAVSGSVTIAGHALSFNQSIDWGFSVPGLNAYTLDTLLAAIAAGTQNQQTAQVAIDDLLSKAMVELGEVAIEQLVGGSGGPLDKLQSSAESFCSSATPDDPFCESNAPATAQPQSGSGSSSGSVSSDDEAAMCPANIAQDQFVFVCLPTFVAGDFDTGSKPLVILPGGALIVLPIGGDSLLSLSTTPTISSSKAIVSLGGLLVGYNLKLKAPDLAVAAGAVDMAGALTLDGDNVNAGTVNLDEATGALPSAVLNNQYYKDYQQVAKAVNLPSPIPTSGSFSTPLSVAAASITSDPAKSFQLGSSSTLSTSGRGGQGGIPEGAVGGLPGGEAPGGAKDGYGGSHGGYGGIVEQIWGGQEWGSWQGSAGRGATFDDPFAPSQPGNGGSGNYRDNVDSGAFGGGVVRINGPKTSVQIDGTIDASGENDGACEPDCNPYAPEAAGAGGSIYVTAKTLAGAGDIGADGGGYPAGWVNTDGGEGGGGRISLVYGDNSGWQGSVHAHGGVDQNFHGLTGDQEFFDGTGGAGTVFTRQVTFNADGSIKAGAGEFTDGTLTIDGGQAPGYYPPPDGTPIADSWGSPQRKLVLTGEARGYGTSPNFGEIDVLDGADLTSEFTNQTLAVTAGTLKVDASSRIDMSGRGFGGGAAGFDANDLNGGAAQTAAGQAPSVIQAGGSHGGAGGLAWPANYVLENSRAGATYDDPQNPSLPGGGGAGGFDTETGNPGGGVLDVTAGTLQLDGALSADGEDGGGATAADPTMFSHYGGAGAGGSVLVHAGALSGGGVMRADGGWACLTSGGGRLLPNGDGCESGDGGAGGGGRVALYAPSCSWTGTLEATGGINQALAGGDVEQTTGQDGSTYFSTGSASCSTTTGGGTGSGEGQSPPPPAEQTLTVTKPGLPTATRPNTKLAKTTINKRKHTAMFSFKALGTGSGFQCALVKQQKKRKGHKQPKPSFSGCGSPKTYKHLAHGSYTFYVRALNSAGADLTPASARFGL